MKAYMSEHVQRRLCKDVCKCLSICEDTRGWAAQALLVEPLPPPPQPSTSGCADLECKIFCGIYKILLGKKPQEPPHLGTQPCFCDLCVGLGHVPFCPWEPGSRDCSICQGGDCCLWALGTAETTNQTESDKVCTMGVLCFGKENCWRQIHHLIFFSLRGQSTACGNPPWALAKGGHRGLESHEVNLEWEALGSNLGEKLWSFQGSNILDSRAAFCFEKS